MAIRLDDYLNEASTVTSRPEEKPEPVSGIRLDDYVSTQKIPVDGGVFELTPEKQTEWEERGPIGYIEQLRRTNKLGMLPGVGAYNDVQMLLAFKRHRNNQYNDEIQRESDNELIGNYLERAEEERVRGKTGTWLSRIPGQIARGQTALPAYMIEFAATGGLATAVKASVRKGLTGVVRSAAISRALTTSAELAAGAAARTVALAPIEVTKGFAERQINSGLQLTEKGLSIADTIAEKPFTSFAKAVGDTYIEMFSEDTGGLISKGLGKFVPKQFKTSMEKVFSRLHPGEAVSKLWTKTGYNGFIGEIGEEQLGAVLRALTGVDDFGADDPGNIFDRVTSSFFNAEELLVTAGVLALPGAGFAGLNQAINLVQKRKSEFGDKTPPLKEITDEQLEEIVGAAKAEKLVNEESPPKPTAAVATEPSPIESTAAVLPQEQTGADISEPNEDPNVDDIVVADESTVKKRKGKPTEEDINPGLKNYTPEQIAALRKKTISEFNLSDAEAEGFDKDALEATLIAGTPTKAIVDRARLMRDTEIAQAGEVTIAEIREKIGQFRITSGERDILEELAAVPKELVAEDDMTALEGFDPFVEKMKESGLGGLDSDSTTSDVLDVLRKAVKEPTKKPTIKSFIEDAKREIIEEAQGDIVTQSQQGLKEAIENNTGQSRPGEDPKITQTEALKYQLEYAEKASKAGFREGKKVGKELVKSAKEIINRRRKFVAMLQEEFQLSNSDMRKAGGKAGGKDIRLMRDFEFKQYLDKLSSKAIQVRETKDAKLQLLSTLHEGQFKKESNLRKAMGLPPIYKMTTAQLKSYEETLSEFEVGDEFLSKGAIETVDNTELSGARTTREVLEILAAKTGVTVDEVVNDSKYSSLDKISNDVILARKGPLYAHVIQLVNIATYNAKSKDIAFSREVDVLANAARKARETGLVDKLVPTDDLIVEYLESSDPVSVAKKMTKEDLDFAFFAQQTLAGVKDRYTAIEVLKRTIANYFPHFNKGFLETVKSDGIIEAVKETFQQDEMHDDNFKVLGSDGKSILSYEKFFGNALTRTGEIVPSRNVSSVLKRYMSSVNLKDELDRVVPSIKAYANALSKTVTTPHGEYTDRRLNEFISDFINNKKGIRSDLGGFLPQGGLIDRTLHGLTSYISLLQIGLNVGVNLATPFGEKYATATNIGFKKYALGEKRSLTSKGKAIIEANRAFVGVSSWEGLRDTGKSIGDKFHSALFAWMHQASVSANAVHLLGSLTDAEWNSGEISPERRSDLYLEIQRFRHLPGTASVIGSTSLIKTYTQYKTWAVPYLISIGSNLAKLTKMATSGKKADIMQTKEFQELLRGTLMAVIAYGSYKTMFDDDDNSFLAKMAKKIMDDLTGIMGSANPLMWVKSIPVQQFLINMAEGVSSLIKVENGRLEIGKGVKKILKTNTPVAISQLSGDKNNRKRIRFND